MNEIWKDIKGYEGIYKISSCGNIANTKRLLKPKTDKHGYKTICLSKDKKIKVYFIHRLVMLEFTPNPDDKPQVNHIDGIKSNNKLTNLEWCTAKENISHAIKNGLIDIHKNQGITRKLSPRPESYSRKISIKDASKIRDLYKQGHYTYKSISKMYPISSVMVGHIIRGTYW